MSDQPFSLVPFAQGTPQNAFQIEGQIDRRGSKLTIRYAVIGPLADLSIPNTVEPPTRKNGLWEDTCFELFLAAKDSPRYWEFNLSPSGDWSVYRFASYRKGMEEERAFTSLPFQVQREPKALRMELVLDLREFFSPEETLEAGISAVLKKRNGDLSYWALTHPRPEPDFHHRKSFIMHL